jgi:chromosome segregation ATPase
VSELQHAKQRLEDQLKSQQTSSQTYSGAVKQEEGAWEVERVALEAQLADREKELKEIQVEQEIAKKEVQQVHNSLRSVQAQLSETSNLYIAQGDKLREVRTSRMELDQENTTLKTSLSRTKSEVKKWKRKFEEVSEEMKSLAEVRGTCRGLRKEVESLINHNKDVKYEVKVLRGQTQHHRQKPEAKATGGQIRDQTPQAEKNATGSRSQTPGARTDSEGDQANAS